MTVDTLNIWEGIYRDFEEAGGSTDVFSESHWVDRAVAKAAKQLEELNSTRFAPIGTGSTAYVLPAFAAALQAKKGRIRIMDFGGSIGVVLPSLIYSLARPRDIEVHVVDNESTCRAGRDVFAGDERIQFHPSPPDDLAFDIVHCGSSIQYVSNWAATIRQLVQSRPEYLVFDDLPAGEVPTFVSLQNYYGKKIPHWFFNTREFVETVAAETGYGLCYKARYIGTFLGKVGILPMDNFPPDYRIDNAYNLAFAPW